MANGSVTLPSFREAFRLWAYVGCVNFGGPAGQIALMHKLLVEEKRWISDARYFHPLNYCMLLPGPEAQQLATFIGWRLHGLKGGLVAGLAFVLPGAAVMLALCFLCRQKFKADTPGPMKDEKMTPRIAETAKGLWLVYVGVSAACVLCYRWAGMTWF